MHKEIKTFFKKYDADWLSYSIPSADDVKRVSEIISIKNVNSLVCLYDRNLTKSKNMAILKEKLIKRKNSDFRNLTKNVLNQKESNLCVPISVSALLRWTIKNDLKIKDREMNEYFTLERIFKTLTMIIYPRSFAGFNLNPKKEEQKFQETEIELLLRRLKYKTYLNRRGWELLNYCLNYTSPEKSRFDFKKGLNLKKNK